MEIEKQGQWRHTAHFVAYSATKQAIITQFYKITTSIEPIDTRYIKNIRNPPLDNPAAFDFSKMNPVARRNDRTNSRHHGKKLQEDALIAIEEMYVRTPTETWSFVVKSAKEEHCIPVPDNTIRRWWLHFEEYGEYPFETRKTMKFLRKLGKKFKRTKVVTEDIVQCLKLITEEHPEFYMDEIQMAVCVQKRVFISEATLTRVLKEKLGYSLQVCYDSALQRSQSQRALYKASLKGLVRNANQLIFVDETHKDKAASRRRKAWGIRNSGGIGIQRWFKNEARYTMIASALSHQQLNVYYVMRFQQKGLQELLMLDTLRFGLNIFYVQF